MSVKPTLARVRDVPRRALPPSADLAERLAASPFLIALDIDGTLAPIAPTPQSAAVPEETRRVLDRLTTMPNVHVAFVTGRGARDGRRLVDVANSWTIGNHGIELIDPTGAVHVNAAAESFAQAIEEAARALGEPLRRFEGVFIENKTWTLSIHVRLASPDVVPNVERAVADVAQALHLKIIEGKKIFELRPPVSIHKGTALIELATSLRVFRDGTWSGSVLYAGDDRTDEDAFRALRLTPSTAVTIHVGKSELPEGIQTTAEFVLDDPLAVQEFLKWLTTLRGSA